MTFTPGIKSRLLLLGILPAALIGLALIAFLSHSRTAGLDSHLREHGMLIAKHVASASVEGIIAHDPSLLQDLANQTLDQADLIAVEIFDGVNLLASARLQNPHHGHEHDGEALVLVAPITSSEGYSRIPPSTASGPDSPILGEVRVVLSRQGIIRRRRDALIGSLGILMGGLLVTALLAFRAGRTISSPILSLTTAVSALSRGNLGARAESQATPELATLQGGFNAMATELQRNQQHLEDQIQQATQQLQDTLKSLEKRNVQLELARQHAETQTNIKTQFLAQMSHEIRTPMNGIIGFAELLAQTPLTEEQSEQLRLIERSAKNLLAIINEILDLSKLEAGKISLNVHEFVLRPYLEDAIALQAPKAPNLTIILWIEPAVPQTVLGDPLRLHQVITNLLGNALKFTQRGRIVIRVRLRSNDQRQWLLLSVSDSGNGIAPKDMGDLFQPFIQLSEFAINHERGAGLGLTIAKNIVERMKGKIGVASRLHKGTTFWFSLPLGHLERGAEQTLEYTAALIDTDALSRQALCYQLENLGTVVSSFASFDEFAADYSPEKHGAFVVLNGEHLQNQTGIPLSRWLEQCRTKKAMPILILRERRQRLLSFYRQQGAICLSHPVRAERLRAAFRSASSAGRPQAAEPIKHPQQEAHGAKNFLIADDNEINRLLLRSQLSRFGAEITEAHDGREALDLIMAKRFDLIFLDLQMPVMSGMSVIQAVRNNPGFNRNTPVVAVTAHAQPEQQVAVMRDGFTACLIKPIMDQQLVALVQGQLVAADGPVADSDELIGSGSECYVQAILEKTNHNQKLASVIARKLFQELPEQLGDIRIALQAQELETALRLTHLVHGSGAFCGLTGIQRAAAALEASLRQWGSGESLQELQRELAREIDQFMAHEETIIDRLTEGDQQA